MAKIDRQSQTNRILITILMISSIFSMMLVWGIWLDIKPSNIVDALTVKVSYINASTVYMMNSVRNDLNAQYMNQSTEFVYCLHGQVYKDGYLINSITPTVVISSYNDKITYKPCDRSSDYIGTIHSHPTTRLARYIVTCKPSSQDIYTFGAEKTQITGIICGLDSFGFYGTNDFENSFQVQYVEVKNK